MFGKRKQDDTNRNSAATETKPGSDISPTKSFSRPDAAAVLGRQPSPAIRSDSLRRSNSLGASPPRRSSDETESKKLIVGRGISLSGEIKACEKLVVEGEVEADLAGCEILEISESGLYKGSASVTSADISGRFEGKLTVHELLLVRASGHVTGTIHYGELEIERGGRITGTIELSKSSETSAGRSEPGRMQGTDERAAKNGLSTTARAASGGQG
jgi:cytoskeletal protein CcmA (bactofilin family)